MRRLCAVHRPRFEFCAEHIGTGGHGTPFGAEDFEPGMTFVVVAVDANTGMLTLALDAGYRGEEPL